MSNRPAVTINQVHKTFHLPGEHAGSLRSRFVHLFSPGTSGTPFHALRDVSCQIQHGEFFGIVGRNGSGKSTLLKILAGIVLPTSGSMEVDGTLSPFLELGVGFNTELTAKENIYLGGAIMGMGKEEISGLYQQILDFSELQQFEHVKLKHFSSGMYVRLAFSMAIHAPSDILLMDEVLAVGDERFQEKCTAVFHRLKQEKKTVILVSHDMHAITTFCDRVMVLHQGAVHMTGSAHEAAEAYHLLNHSPT